MRASRLQVREGTLETAWWGPGPTQAPTLVLLHEGLGSVELWRDIPERLANATGYGVFAWSRFGYGRSDPVPLPRPVTYMHHEAQSVLPEVLQAAGVQRFILLGHSDGGSIAAIYAGTRSWPPLDRPPPPPAPTLTALITIAPHFFVEDLNIASIERIRTEYETGTLRPRLARYHQNVDTAFRGWNGAWLNPAFRHFDITSFLPAITVPILALQGEQDPYGSAEQLHVFAAKAQAPITTKLIPGAQHSPHLEAKEATLAAITRFITDLPA
jgi:pimeloyl-ACP methyl ester carboxylesterase